MCTDIAFVVYRLTTLLTTSLSDGQAFKDHRRYFDRLYDSVKANVQVGHLASNMADIIDNEEVSSLAKLYFIYTYTK